MFVAPLLQSLVSHTKKFVLCCYKTCWNQKQPKFLPFIRPWVLCTLGFLYLVMLERILPWQLKFFSPKKTCGRYMWFLLSQAWSIPHPRKSLGCNLPGGALGWILCSDCRSFRTSRGGGVETWMIGKDRYRGMMHTILQSYLWYLYI